jgi:hypothetical protein
MSVIVAAIGPDGTWIGSDTLGVNGDDRIVETQPKWKISPDRDWAFAGCGSVDYGPALLGEVNLESGESLLWDHVADDSKSPEVRLRDLMAGMRQAIKSAGGEPVRDDGEVFPCYRFAALVATPGRIWRLNPTLLSADQPLEGTYQAVGYGADYAVAAMSALRSVGVKSAEDLVTEAVRVACRMSAYCNGEAFVERLCGYPGRVYCDTEPEREGWP